MLHQAQHVDLVGDVERLVLVDDASLCNSQANQTAASADLEAAWSIQSAPSVHGGSE